MELKFNKKPKRDKALTIRLSQDSLDRLKAIANHYEVSQADVIESLIDNVDLKRKPKKS